MTVQEDKTQKVLAIVGLAARLMLQNGAETYRVEETVMRMGKNFGCDGVETLALSTGILISVSGDMQHQAVVRRVHQRTNNLQIVNEVNALSRRVAMGQVSMERTWEELKEIEKIPAARPWQNVVSAGLGAGSFAVMFGANLLDFFVAVCCGLLGQVAGILLRRENMHLVFSSLFGGVITAVVVMAAFFAFDLDMASLEAITTGAILPLMSGLIMTNAVRDSMRGDLVSGLARGAEGLMIAIMVATGIGVVSQFFLPSVVNTAMRVPPFWLSVLCSALATLAYALLMGVPVKSMPITGVIAAIGYGVYLIFVDLAGEQVGLFVSSVVICVLSEISARRFRAVTTLFLCTALMPLVPGVGLFRTMRELVLENFELALVTGANTLFALGSIALGVAIGSLLVSSFLRIGNRLAGARRN